MGGLRRAGVAALIGMVGCGARSDLLSGDRAGREPEGVTVDATLPPPDREAGDAPLDVAFDAGAAEVHADGSPGDGSPADALWVEAGTGDATQRDAGGDDGARDGPGETGAGDAGDAGEEAPEFRSCAPGMTNCGPDGGESCCTSLEVTAGTFYRTYSNDGGGATGEADPATVSAFRLDKYEVTVGRFRQFVSAVLPPDGGAGWLPPAGSGKHSHLNGGLGLGVGGSAGTYEPGWLVAGNAQIAPTDANLTNCKGLWPYATWTPSPGQNENKPITCLNSFEPYAFCIWDGGFLPSQAEWEYAAAGGSEQREYPWGSVDPGTRSLYAIYDCYYPTGVLSACTSVDNMAPVGTATLGAGRWGHLDLAGNALERVLDRYVSPLANPCVDCTSYAPSNDYQDVVGADFTAASSLSPPWYSGIAPPESRWPTVGVRCARRP